MNASTQQIDVFRWMEDRSDREIQQDLEKCMDLQRISISNASQNRAAMDINRLILAGRIDMARLLRLVGDHALLGAIQDARDDIHRSFAPDSQSAWNRWLRVYGEHETDDPRCNATQRLIGRSTGWFSGDWSGACLHSTQPALVTNQLGRQVHQSKHTLRLGLMDNGLQGEIIPDPRHLGLEYQTDHLTGRMEVSGIKLAWSGKYRPLLAV